MAQLGGIGDPTHCACAHDRKLRCRNGLFRGQLLCDYDDDDDDDDDDDYDDGGGGGGGDNNNEIRQFLQRGNTAHAVTRTP